MPNQQVWKLYTWAAASLVVVLIMGLIIGLMASFPVRATERLKSLECLHAALQAELAKRSAQTVVTPAIRFENAAPDPNQLKQVSNLVDTMNHRFSRYFPMPRNLEIVIKDKAVHAETDSPWGALQNRFSQNNTVYASDQERVVYIRDSLRRIREAEIAHEIGHGMFVERMVHTDPEWREGMIHIKEVYGDLRRFVQSGGIPGPDGMPLKPPVSTPEFKAAVARSGYSVPYQELFADCVAVINSDDPHAISKWILEDATKSLDTMEARVRSFDTRQSKKEIEEYLRIQNSLSESDPERHADFKETQFFLWKQYFEKTKDPNKRVEILDRVFDVIASDMKENFNNGDPAKRSVEEMNQSLMRKIRAAKIDL